MNEWVNKQVAHLRKVLGLEPGWRIHISYDDKPDGDELSGGTCAPTSTYLNASIVLHSDIQPDDVGRETVTHEVLHVAHSEVDHVVLLMADNVPKADREFFWGIYQEAVEKYVQRTSRSLTPHLKED